MKKPVFIIRPMQPSDIVDAMKLSDAEGWNQTPKDWKLLIEGPQNICLVAECGKKIIGTTTAINYSNQIAWIGMVLVAKEHRRQGVSKSLLKNILKELVDSKSIKLDATPEGQRVYKQFDFNEEYLIARMVNGSINELPPDEEVWPEPIKLNDLEEIVALDELVFGANRTQLIESMIKAYPDKAWLLRRNNSIVGFALGRKGNRYHQLGPVFASNINNVKILITKALKELTHQPVVMDVLCDKEDLITWLNYLGFASQRQFVRMYQTQNPFPGSIEKQYAICGPEFG
jgi:GNAT acetyltransferase-like protein/acetyltransferase (GNAT) family protein